MWVKCQCDDCRAEAWVHVFEKARWRIALSTLDSGEDGGNGKAGKTVIGCLEMGVVCV